MLKSTVIELKDLPGVKFNVTQYLGRKAMRLYPIWTKLTAKVGPYSEGTAKDNPEDARKLLEGLSDWMQKDCDEKVQAEILEGVVMIRDGVSRAINVDQDFLDCIDSYYELIQKILMFQFGEKKTGASSSTDPSPKPALKAM